MRILVLSKECWRDDQNGGNVLSNMFEGFDAEFAQIYCSAGEPLNNICRHYFQVTDSEVVRYCLCKLKVESIGHVRYYENYPQVSNSNNDVRIVSKWMSGNLARVAREIVWKIAHWKSEKLKQFILGFNPDIVFAPCYGNHYMLGLTRFVYDITHKPIISYISDDHYTLNQFNFSLVFWVNHLIRRRNARRTIKLFSLMYTMTEEQKIQCEKDFGVPMKILCKSGVFPKEKEKKTVNNPLRFIYAGGIYLNRWKTLSALAKAMRKINSGGVKCVLDIYTNNKLPGSQAQLINDGHTANMHAGVPLDELKRIYAESDIALHVESFDIENRMKVRLSFSTKIIDCLESGCAVMAICDRKQAGFAYLKRNNAAICIDDTKELDQTLRSIINNPKELIQYQKNAFELGRKAHDKVCIQEGIKHDFMNLII